MKGLPKFSTDYFEKFGESPVDIKSYNPKSKKVATHYIEELKKLLGGFQADIAHRGSTAFGIAGKGDVEIGVYPTVEDWKKVLIKLEKRFGKSGNLESDYARFNDDYQSFDVEIIVMKGCGAVVDKRLAKYLLSKPDLLSEYEKVKKGYSHSKREY